MIFSDRTGAEAVLAFALCVVVFAICGVFGEKKWLVEAKAFFARTFDLW